MGQAFFDEGRSRIGYFNGRQPAAYLELLRDSIVLLDRCVSAARTHVGEPDDKERAASLNMTLGFGLLAMSESRAALVLLSLQLERSARIHLRSLHEYVLRAKLVQDVEIARAFKLAAAQETRKYGKWLNYSERQIREAEGRFLGDIAPGEEVTSERSALGGPMQSLMRKHSGGDKQYALTFGFPSLFSHGSILALNEVSNAIEGRQADFAEVSFRDGIGPVSLLDAVSQVCQLSDLLVEVFGIAELAPDLDAIGPRLAELAKPLPG